jgi:uncharacterized protein (TIGR00255 family)
MLMSMTGFARASAENDRYEAVVEIKTVNHRYLEVRMRAQGGGGLASYDKKIRDRVGSVLSRGKADVGIYLRSVSESAYEIDVDRPLVQELVRVARSLGEETGVGTDLSLSDLVGFTPAFQVRERRPKETAKLEDALDRALDAALDGLQRMREAEGAELQADLESRTGSLRALLEGIERRSEESRSERRAELETKVGELLAGAEGATVVAEVARLVERSDIAEEVTRFRSHLSLWQSAVSGKERCGKKLDFIVQEMNREVNTIGSKCQDSRIAESVIEMKSELERVREQVQNVE